MARVIAGIDIGATLRQSLLGVLEQGIVLARGATRFTAEGLFERTPDGGAQVLLMPKTGTLGEVRPVAGDYIEYLDDVMRVRSTGGMDDVFWQLTCTPAIDRTARPDAPSLTLAKLSNLNVKASISQQIPSGAFLRTRVRRGGSPFWFNDLYQRTRIRTIKLPGAGVYEIGAAIIAKDGTASTEAIEVLPEAA